MPAAGENFEVTRCAWTEACSFFTDEVGYSIDLQGTMRASYCMGDNTNCARLDAINYLPFNKIPQDLIPTDHERLQQLIDEYEREICKRRKNQDPDCC